MESKKLYKIGEVSKLTETTIAAIRHYQKIGLIIPELVDSTTGYRYFSYKNLIKIKTISYLRKMDFSIKDIIDIIERPIVDILDIFEININNIETEIQLLEVKKENIKKLKRVYEDQLSGNLEESLIKSKSIGVKLEEFKNIDMSTLNYVTNKYKEDVKSVGIIKNSVMKNLFVELYSGHSDYLISGGNYRVFRLDEKDFSKYINENKEFLVFVKYSTVFNWEYEVREKI